MHLRNKTVVGLLFALNLFANACLWAQGTQAASAAPGQSQAAPAQAPLTQLPSDFDSSDPAVPVWARRATPATPANAAPSGPSTTAGNIPAGAKPTPSIPDLSPNVDTTNQVTTDKKGGFVFVSRVNEVTLTATVLDQRHHLVTDLSPRDFVVYEDGQPQQITSFKREDIPVSIGILVDNSGSMRTKRNAVSKAVVNLVQASNARDEVFVVNFNDEPYLDQDFTSKVELLKEAIDHVDSRGGTALYDAVVASADHLKGAKLEKKVLLVVTDGEDNESRDSLEQAIRAVQNDNGPTIYTIGILSEEGKQRRAKRALESLSVQTGGVAFFPKNLQEVDEISRDVARDIRNQYSITYKPTNPRSNGGYRTVKVVAHAPGYKDLQVRTRSGYFANEPPKTAANAPTDNKQ